MEETSPKHESNTVKHHVQSRRKMLIIRGIESAEGRSEYC